MCRQRAGCNPGTANADDQRPEGLVAAAARDLESFQGFKRLKPGLECPNNRGLCAGKGQAATLEQQTLTARGLGGSCPEGFGGF